MVRHPLGRLLTQLAVDNLLPSIYEALVTHGDPRALRLVELVQVAQLNVEELLVVAAHAVLVGAPTFTLADLHHGFVQSRIRQTAYVLLDARFCIRVDELVVRTDSRTHVDPIVLDQMRITLVRPLLRVEYSLRHRLRVVVLPRVRVFIFRALADWLGCRILAPHRDLVAIQRLSV